MASDAKMLIRPGGEGEAERLGTVGGGCLEAEVTEVALAAVADGRPVLIRETLNADLAGDLGLSCGGTVEVFVEPWRGGPEMERLCRLVAGGPRDRIPIVVLTARDWSGDGGEGEGGGGGAKLAKVGDRVARAGREGFGPVVPDGSLVEVGRVPVEIDSEGGILIERIPRRPRVVVFGAGHVGREIARLAAHVGFHVVVADDRAEFANADRIPEAHEVMAAPFPDVVDALTIDADDYLVVATRGHAFDATIVEGVADSPARYVGMLGSRRKRRVVLNALETAGVRRSALERVRCPIGVGIGADNPTEIAVSVLAELIEVRRLNETDHQVP